MPGFWSSPLWKNLKKSLREDRDPCPPHAPHPSLPHAPSCQHWPHPRGSSDPRDISFIFIDCALGDVPVVLGSQAIPHGMLAPHQHSGTAMGAAGAHSVLVCVYCVSYVRTVCACVLCVCVSRIHWCLYVSGQTYVRCVCLYTCVFVACETNVHV